MKSLLLPAAFLMVSCVALYEQETIVGTPSGRYVPDTVHAVIISGGMNKLMNHERYWNDCTRLAPHVQWSVGAGLGLQYSLSPSVGFFAEPSMQYYFPNHSTVSTWRTDHPLTPTLPAGLRITF